MIPGSRTVVWSQMDSPVGPLTLAMTAKGVCSIEFGKGEQTLVGIKVWAEQWGRSVKIEQNDRACAPAMEQLKEYFERKRQKFDVPVDLYGTPFQKAVWRQLQAIPYGQVRSYKDIAKAIGAPKAVRAVGGANNKNPVPIIVPCHRVIGSNGSLVGYGGGLHIKEKLLALEGYLPPQQNVSH